MSQAPSDIRIELAARVGALVNALRGIPAELAPVKRATTQAIREQIYHGYEMPLARARGGPRWWGKYEEDRPWSTAAASLVRSGGAERGKRGLNRDHVYGAAIIVDELLERPRSPAEIAELLDIRLATCTVLESEHARLGRISRDVVGWDRYRDANVVWQKILGR